MLAEDEAAAEAEDDDDERAASENRASVRRNILPLQICVCRGKSPDRIR